MISDDMYITEISWNDLDDEKYKSQPKVLKGRGMFGTDNGLHSMDVGIVSGDMLDADMQHKLEDFDKEQTQAILESQDIVKAYNAFIDLRVDELSKMTFKQAVDKDTPRIIHRFVESYEDFSGKYGGERIKKELKEMFIWQSEDPDYIRDLLKTRLEYANTTQQMLRKIIEKNAAFLKISSSELQTLLNPSFKNVKAMREAIAKNEKEFIKNKYLADCRSIGAGVFVTAKDFEIGEINVKFEDYIQDIINYDLVVLAHGNDSNIQEDSRLNNSFEYAYNTRINFLKTNDDQKKNNKK